MKSIRITYDFNNEAKITNSPVASYNNKTVNVLITHIEYILPINYQKNNDNNMSII